MARDFEADLDPQTHRPRIRFNFANGWSASVVLLDADGTGCNFLFASVASCPTGKWCTGKTEIEAHEASADEVASLLSEICAREALS